MKEDFVGLVRAELDGLLAKSGFAFRGAVQADGGEKLAAIYESSTCKILIYQSRRDGEVNCLVGNLEADAKRTTERWTFLYSLLDSGAGLSIEELLSRVPKNPKGTKEQLREITETLAGHMQEVVTRCPR